MDILKYFDKEMNVTASIQELKTVVNPITHIQTKSYVEVATTKGFLQTRSQSNKFISARWSDLVTEIFICEPPLNVSNESKLVINGTEYYAEVPDDVGNQGEVLVIGLKVTK